MRKVLAALQVVVCVVLCAAMGAGLIAPLAGAGGLAVDRLQKAMESNLKDLTNGSAPGVTTITDKNGQPMAYIYDQRRYELTQDQIAPIMKQAIVSVEDKRFFEHGGVDWQGTLRAMVTNLLAGGVEQGASTLDQQYVKNYLLLVDAEDDAEKAAATETSYARKLREMKMASELERVLSKEEILTRYLNIVPFGNGAFGIEAAALTYFGIHASELNAAQSAMLAGIVQSSSRLNPYTNVKGVTERRNTVLDTMVETDAITQEEADRIKKAPLGVLPEPNELPNGCLYAGNRGFFCDYVLTYLAKKGLDEKTIKRGSYVITTTLDPAVQDAAHAAATSQANPKAEGVAAILDIIEPGTDSRHIQAMTTSRTYGLNADNAETVFAQTSTTAGSGAGSVFKLFTTAAAMEKGLGIDTVVPVPPRVEVKGMGQGGAKGCKPNHYCVVNAGSYKKEMPLHDTLAFSPNTTFVKMIEQVGVKETMDMAIRLGLRSYTQPGSYEGNQSIADYITSKNLGSFTLGPTPVNPLELSNVAATLASDGVWCEPNPILSVTGRDGAEIDIRHEACEQVVAPELAHTLADGMSHDVQKGTAAGAAGATGWHAPTAAKTGTTETHSSAAFLGFNSKMAAAAYVYNDGKVVKPLCTSPLRQCPNGNLYGGMEPARVWMTAAKNLGYVKDGTLPKPDKRYVEGTAKADIPDIAGLSESDARTLLNDAGFTIIGTKEDYGDGVPRGLVVKMDAGGAPILKGSHVTLVLSNGLFTPPKEDEELKDEDNPFPDIAPPPAPDIIQDLGQALGDFLGLN